MFETWVSQLTKDMIRNKILILTKTYLQIKNTESTVKHDILATGKYSELVAL